MGNTVWSSLKQENTNNTKPNGPILTAIDENYVLVNFQNINPLPDNRIDLRNADYQEKILGVADKRYDQVKYGPTQVIQPLYENKTFVTKMDACTDYDNLLLRIDGIISNDIPVEYHPNATILEQESSNWICIQNETLKLIKFNQKRSCLKEGEILFSDGGKYKLSDDETIEVNNIPSRRVTLTELKYDFDTNVESMPISLTDCKVELLPLATIQDDTNINYLLIIGISAGVVILVIVIVVYVLVVVKRKRDRRVSIDVNPNYGRSIYLNYYQSSTVNYSQDSDEMGVGEHYQE